MALANPLPYFLPALLPGPLDPLEIPTDPLGGGAGDLAYLGSICDQSFALLISQYQDSPLVKAWICSYLHALEGTDDAAVDVWARVLDLDTAEGVALDIIGRIVREARGGRGDYLYRNALRVRVLVNKSQGRIEDLIAIAALFEGVPVGAVRLSEVQPARIEVRITGTPVNPPAEVDKRLRLAKSAGVALTTIVQAYPATTGRGFRLSLAADYPEKNTTEGLSDGSGSGGYLLHAMG